MNHHLIRDYAIALQCKALSDGRPVQAHTMAVAKRGIDSVAARIAKSWSVGETSEEARAAQRQLVQLSARRSLVSMIAAIAPYQRVPFSVPTLAINAGATATFVRDGAVVPVSTLDLDPVTVPPRGIHGIVPATAESVRALDAEAGITQSLTRAIANGESAKFFSDDEGDEDAPAGILHGVTPHDCNNEPHSDIDALLEDFDGNLAESVILTSPRNGLTLHAVGFDTTGARGGEIAGIAHVTHHAIPENRIAIIEPARIMMADDGEVEIDFSAYATLNVTGADGATDQVSLMQTGAVAWKVSRTISWAAAAGAVAWIATSWTPRS